MLYLEDYMEMIENLPMEMRDRFTEMREMDLEVQNGMDSLEERLKNFFKKCGTTPNLKQDWKDETFNKIKEDYHKTLEQADEKVQLATTIHDLLERYLRKLDQEVLKFKMELEADSMGITEVLEKRSLELDRPTPAPSNHRTAEKRKYSSMLSHHLEKRSNLGPQPSPDTLNSSLAETLTRSSSVATATAASPAAVTSIFSSASSASTPALSYSLGHVGAGSNAAIAAAASRAIGATLEMQQGRRTASLKASYEAVTRQQSGFSKEFATFATQSASSSFGGAVVSSAGETLPPPPPPATKSSSSRHKKSRAHQQALKLQREREAAEAAAAQLAAAASTAVVSDTPNAAGDASATGGDDTSNSWQFDPNEPRYCICNDVSYGDMVGCDNTDCPIEWFHYPCVGLNQAPKGKWYCPQCAAAMKRRGRK